MKSVFYIGSGVGFPEDPLSVGLIFGEQQGNFTVEMDLAQSEFGMLGINPKEGASLVWKFVQYYDDGSTEEFTGPVGSRLPSPVTVLKKAAQ